jgi:drug/metabolite transporter (DMT)-like permease
MLSSNSSPVVSEVAPGVACVPIAAVKQTIDPRLVAALAAVYVVWSSTYLAIRIAVSDLPPLVMASMRFLVAGLVMLAIAKRRGAAWPPMRQWRRIAPIGVLLFIGGNGFVAIGEQTVSSGGTALVGATMPLWTGVLALVTGDRPTRREWLSLALGFVGVIVLLGGPSLDGEPLHVALVLLAPACWSLGSIFARRLSQSDPIDSFMSSAMQMLGGGIALAIVGFAIGEPLPLHASARSWLAVAYLLVFGSLIAFTAYAWLLRHARPIVATSYAYVNPVLAVLIGAVVSGESLGVTTLVANALIVGAVALALRKPGNA